MIGKQIRSLRHLSKNLNNYEPKKMVISNGVNAIYGSVVKVENDGYQTILFFNNVKGERDTNRYCSDNSCINDLKSRYKSFFPITDDCRKFFAKRILLPDNIDEMFSDFKNNNKKLLANVLNDSFGGESIPLYLYIYYHESPNLYAWALKNFYKVGTSIGALESIINWSSNYSQLVKNLKRGTITAYNKTTDIISMYNEMVSLRRVKRANDVINTFNTTQKKLLKSIELDDKTIFILNRFSTLSDVKKRNFVRKMSTIEDVSEILKQMSFAINLHFEWNHNSLMEYIKNSDVLKCEVIYDKNNIVIVRCNDYETIKHLGKTTNWCISKNKTYWRQYMSNVGAKQYVMFNFNEKEDSEESIIGFTSKWDTMITHAHSFTNENLVKNSDCMYIGDMVSFMSKNNGIMEILNQHGITIDSLFGHIDKKPYDWNKESVIDYLNKIIGEDNYDVILDENEKFVIISKHYDIIKMFNENIYNEYLGRYMGYKHILFFDFSKNENDIQRLKFSIVLNIRHSQEEIVHGTYNADCTQIKGTFDSLLIEFGLPYDIICRIESNMSKLKNAVSFYDMKMLDLLLKDTNVVKILRNRASDENWSYEGFFDKLYMSIFDAKSFDFVNTLYNNNLKLQDVLKKCDVSNIMECLLDNIIHIGQGDIPTSEDIEFFNNGLITDYNKRKFIGFYLIFDKLMNGETSINKNFCYHKIHRRFSFCCTLTQYVYDKLFDKINFSKKNEISSIVFNHIIECKNMDYINKIKKMDNVHEYFNNAIESSFSIS